MEFNKKELYLIYNCLQDCLNQDDWSSYEDPIEGTLAKIEKMLNKFN